MLLVTNPLWVVGVNVEDDDGETWEIVGVFDSEEKAIAACVDEHYFVGPVKLNEVYDEPGADWPGLYFPHEK